MLGSDHGAVNTPNNLNVGRELEARYGMKTSRDPPLNLWSDKLDKPIDAYGGIWTHQGVTGNCMLHLYIRDPSRPTRDAWRTPLLSSLMRSYKMSDDKEPIDLIQAVLSMDGVELVIVRKTQPDTKGGFIVEVFNRLVPGSRALISFDPATKEYSYQVMGGKDPLSYGGEGTVSHTAEKWLEMVMMACSFCSFISFLPFFRPLQTGKMVYPYGPVRLYRSMLVEDSGDMVITAAKTWDLGGRYEFFGSGNNAGGHGGLRSDQMVVPLVVSGYGVKKGMLIEVSQRGCEGGAVLTMCVKRKKQTATVEDVGATVMEIFGAKMHPDAEGNVLKQALE